MNKIIHQALLAGKYLSHTTAMVIVCVFFFAFNGMNTQASGTGVPEQQALSAAAAMSRPARTLSKEVMAFGLELAEIEQSFDRSLYKVLSDFFEPGTFFVDTRLEMQARPKDRQVIPPVSTPGGGLPGLPGLPDFPGDPVFAGSGTLSSHDISSIYTRLQLKSIHIRIIASHIYEDSDLALMEQLAGATAKLEPGRGDLIEVLRVAFPSSEPEIQLTTVETQASPDISQPLAEKKRLDTPGLILVISSALLIFVIVYLTLALRNKYA